MVYLPDLRDIDRVLFRGREKFDLGFACDCQRGWCAFMNNPEGIQNPRVSCSWLTWLTMESGYVCDLWGQFTPTHTFLFLFHSSSAHHQKILGKSGWW
jgi:hypothetical protein